MKSYCNSQYSDSLPVISGDILLPGPGTMLEGGSTISNLSIMSQPGSEHLHSSQEDLNANSALVGWERKIFIKMRKIFYIKHLDWTIMTQRWLRASLTPAVIDVSLTFFLTWTNFFFVSWQQHIDVDMVNLVSQLRVPWYLQSSY